MRLLRLLAVVALVPTGARLYAASPVAATDEIPAGGERSAAFHPRQVENSVFPNLH